MRGGWSRLCEPEEEWLRGNARLGILVGWVVDEAEQEGQQCELSQLGGKPSLYDGKSGTPLGRRLWFDVGGPDLSDTKTDDAGGRELSDNLVVPESSLAVMVVMFSREIGQGLSVEDGLFDRFSTALFTMFQITTGDGWVTDIVRPMNNGDLMHDFPINLFFVSYFLVANVVMLNIVVSVWLDEFVNTTMVRDLILRNLHVMCIEYTFRMCISMRMQHIDLNANKYAHVWMHGSRHVSNAHNYTHVS